MPNYDIDIMKIKNILPHENKNKKYWQRLTFFYPILYTVLVLNFFLKINIAKTFSLLSNLEKHFCILEG